MKLLIRDDFREVEVYLYGIDNEEHTEEFIVLNFWDKGLKRLSEDDKKRYQTEAEYIVSEEHYKEFLKASERAQEIFDKIAEDKRRTNCNVKETYTYDGKCYVI